MRSRTQAEAGCDPTRATWFVRTRATDYNLPSVQHIASSDHPAGGILCGETILNQSGSVSPTELSADYTPDALDVVSVDAAATAMICSFYGRLSVAEFDPNCFTGAVSTYYYYGIEDPFYDQFEAQAKALAGSDVTP